MKKLLFIICILYSCTNEKSKPGERTNTIIVQDCITGHYYELNQRWTGRGSIYHYEKCKKCKKK